MNKLNDFAKSNQVLEIPFIQDMIEESLTYSDWTDIKFCTEDIEAVIFLAAVQDRLGSALESIGVVDVTMQLHKIKEVYYSLIGQDEYEIDVINKTGSAIMLDMLKSLDKLLAKYDAEYQD